MTDVNTIPVGDMKVRVSGTGFPLILMHGFTTTSEFWREQVAEFSASYQVIRLNLRGHGISPSPTTRSYTIDAFVEDLEGIFQHFSLSRAALVGLSMGGVVAQKFAVKKSAIASIATRQPTALDQTCGPRTSRRLLIVSVLRRPAKT
jgi:3-oxoadipate enol-lactonase